MPTIQGFWALMPIKGVQIHKVKYVLMFKIGLAGMLFEKLDKDDFLMRIALRVMRLSIRKEIGNAVGRSL